MKEMKEYEQFGLSIKMSVEADIRVSAFYTESDDKVRLGLILSESISPTVIKKIINSLKSHPETTYVEDPSIDILSVGIRVDPSMPFEKMVRKSLDVVAGAILGSIKK